MPVSSFSITSADGCSCTSSTSATNTFRPPDMDIWARGSEPFDVEAMAGRRCFAGLDLARVKDLSSLALLFPPVQDGERRKVIWRLTEPSQQVKEIIGRGPYKFVMGERVPGSLAVYERNAVYVPRTDGPPVGNATQDITQRHMSPHL